MKTKSIKTVAVTMFVLFGLLLSNTLSASLFDEKKETRNVGDFNEISLAIPAELHLTQGSKNEVIIEADEDLLEKIITDVRDDELVIKFEKWYNYRSIGKINVYVTVKDIKKLIISGSGEIVAKTPIKADELKLVVTGSGSININDLIVNEVGSFISGSGDIRIEGKSKAKRLDATITGSGDFFASNIEFDNADLTITGSGSIRANITNELEATITGSGRIYYKGNPIIDANITGSGKIRNDD